MATELHPTSIWQPHWVTGVGETLANGRLSDVTDSLSGSRDWPLLAGAAQCKLQLPSTSTGKARGHKCLEGEPEMHLLLLSLLHPTAPEHRLLYVSFQGDMIILIFSTVPHTSPAGEKTNVMFAYTIITLLLEDEEDVWIRILYSY